MPGVYLSTIAEIPVPQTVDGLISCGQLTTQVGQVHPETGVVRHYGGLPLTRPLLIHGQRQLQKGRKKLSELTREEYIQSVSGRLRLRGKSGIYRWYFFQVLICLKISVSDPDPHVST